MSFLARLPPRFLARKLSLSVNCLNTKNALTPPDYKPERNRRSVKYSKLYPQLNLGNTYYEMFHVDLGTVKI